MHPGTINKTIARRNQSAMRGPWEAQKALKDLVIARDGRNCANCGRGPLYGPECTLDHVVPLMLGGSQKPANCQILCPPCHADKTREHDFPETLLRRRFMNAGILFQIGPFVVLDIRIKRWWRDRLKESHLVPIKKPDPPPAPQPLDQVTAPPPYPPPPLPNTDRILVPHDALLEASTAAADLGQDRTRMSKYQRKKWPMSRW